MSAAEKNAEAIAGIQKQTKSRERWNGRYGNFSMRQAPSPELQPSLAALLTMALPACWQPFMTISRGQHRLIFSATG